MPAVVKLALIGLGRIGIVHARHALELVRHGESCDLVAVVDQDIERARALAPKDTAVFATVDELLAARLCSAAVVATPTPFHQRHVEQLLDADCRVLLEKPMTISLAADRVLAARLDASAPQAVMMAFQRRFDEPLGHAKRLLDGGAIGRPFKIVSTLEDSGPLPDGYLSPGLLNDMSVHNVDEVLWLSGKFPTAAASLGSRLYAHRRSTAEEDYDDALMLLQFDRELRAQIEVSRNHVSGYRTETWIFGEKGRIQIGRFEQDPSVVRVEAYGASECIESRGYPMPSHGEDLPEFVGRFGPAYKAELADFVDCCARGAEFAVTHRDALQAMEVIELAGRRVLGFGPRVQ